MATAAQPSNMSKDAATPNTLQRQQQQQQQNRPRRPNYRHLHRFPLPIETYPLPPLIPHNPLSWATIALTYFIRLLSPPTRKKYSAYFDPLTSSVHVTDHETIRALWEMGFFGKGSLSRSEPSWLDREKKRLGLVAGSTAEEVTKARRNERREMKLERARKEREAIAEQLRLEAERKALKENEGASGLVSDDRTVGNQPLTTEEISEAVAAETEIEIEGETETGTGTETVSINTETAATSTVETPVVDSEPSLNANPSITAEQTSEVVQQAVVEEELDIQNQEHLQLSLEEAFFLAYGLGVLNVYDGPATHPSPSIISAPSLFALFRRFSYFPSRDSLLSYEPDDKFIVSYVVYHHFRSLGWVVRSGVKFGVDYILYNRGPVFSHAEFAVVVLPSYSDAYWSETEERRRHVAHRTEKSWWWLHCVNRVQAQVKKTLVLCYVEIPPPSPDPSTAAEEELDIGAQLRAYRVREFSIRRWVPNRTRD